MERQTKEPILMQTYDLLKTAIPMLNAMPKNFKFTLGDRIQNHLGDLLEMTVEALYLPQSEKKAVLKLVNLKLEKLRFLFRLCWELGCFNRRQFEEFARRVDEIGRMTGGWIKSLP